MKKMEPLDKELIKKGFNRADLIVHNQLDALNAELDKDDFSESMITNIWPVVGRTSCHRSNTKGNNKFPRYFRVPSSESPIRLTNSR